MLSFAFSFRDDFIRNRLNVDSRKDLVALAHDLKARGISHVYSEYWIAWSLVAAGEGDISSVGLGYHKKHDKLTYQTNGFSDASYSRECHTYVMPTRRRNARSLSPEENRRIAIKTFGKPDFVFKVGNDYEVMFYEKNIALGCPPLPRQKKRKGSL